MINIINLQSALSSKMRCENLAAMSTSSIVSGFRYILDDCQHSFLRNSKDHNRLFPTYFFTTVLFPLKFWEQPNSRTSYEYNRYVTCPLFSVFKIFSLFSFLEETVHV